MGTFRSPRLDGSDDFLHSRMAQIGGLDCLPSARHAVQTGGGSDGDAFPRTARVAVAATLVQFICAPFIAVGLFTRINGALLVGALSGGDSSEPPGRSRSATCDSLHAHCRGARADGRRPILARRKMVQPKGDERRFFEVLRARVVN